MSLSSVKKDLYVKRNLANFASVMTQFRPYSLRLRDRLVEIDRPMVMGIINVTPDSFFAGSRTADHEAVEARVSRMIAEGVDMIDIGGYSSRPGAEDVSEAEELERLTKGIEAIRRVSGDLPVSVDTFRSGVARRAVADLGADMINDISGGDLDDEMFHTVAELGVPYIVMHMRGNPQTMQEFTDYDNVTLDVVARLAEKIDRLRQLGVADIIADPGFGFSKTPEQNYEILRRLDMIGRELDVPLLVGVSRKSMICRPLAIDPEQALNATTVVNTLALMQGASILRVHDVREAVEAVRIVGMFKK